MSLARFAGQATVANRIALPKVVRFAVPEAAGLVAFVVLFYGTFGDLAVQWWTNPDAGHGLLLAPAAIGLAVRRGVIAEARPDFRLGVALLLVAVASRFVGTLAGELFTMRASMLIALVGLVAAWFGGRQIVAWWLPLSILALAIPLPAVMTNSLAVPLQLVASKIGAGLLRWRQVPFRLEGNVIDIPGSRLFVAEACSGLRSLTALISLGVLIGGLYLRRGPTRVALLVLTIPVAVLLNGFRVFLTAFLIFFVDPEFGRGFMHLSEGWLIFVVALVIIGGIGTLLARLEQHFARTATNG